jgi:AcrR family transcriptional regulator
MSTTPSAATAPRRGRPPKITPEKLVEAALSVGLENLTLAEVAKALNVSIQSLYNHVASRDDLLFMTAAVLSERYPMPEDTGGDWMEWLYRLAYALKSAYEHAPGFATVLMSRSPANAPTVGARWEISLNIAGRCGFEPLTALWVNMAVHEFTYAWVARQEQRRSQEEYLPPRQLTKEGDPAPARIDTTRQAFLESQQLPSALRFDVTLRALIDGLSRLKGQSVRDLGNDSSR